ncbi:MAG: radical SAM protein [Bacteroidota bacterium]
MNVESLVVKIASRCNINCTYCYMYNHLDQSYKLQPKFMSKETINNLKERIKNHCKKHDLNDFFIVMHGGEPLMSKVSDVRYFIETLRSLDKDKIEVHFAVQTNGILINEEFCNLFNEYGVGIGISIDGKKEINDLYRLDKKGRGTFDRVKQGIEQAHQHLNNPLGCLSVVNLQSDPVESYQAFKELNFRGANFLLLDENYDTLDTESDTIKNHKNSDWLIKLFDHWYRIDDKERIRIRKFEDIISYILGSEVGTESAGKGYNKVAVIETNGDIEPLDVLKICGEEFTKHKFNLANNELDDVFESDLVKVYYNSKQYLSKQCLACPVQEVCGGGYIPHRFNSKNGFNNPSIYCKDLLRLITHIQNVVIDDMPQEVVEESSVERLTYEKALDMISENLPDIPEPEYVDLLEHFKQEQTVV